MISRIIKVKVTETLIMSDITKTESNNIVLSYIVLKKSEKQTVARNLK